MNKLAKVILDQYDDIDGDVLREYAPSLGGVPDFIKHASREVQNMADHEFALILLEGRNKLRKFATADKGNTAVSVLYFIKNAAMLPPQVVQPTAQRLVDACLLHDILPPDVLTKLAQEEWGVSGMTQSFYTPGAEALDSSKNYHKDPENAKKKDGLGKDTEDIDLELRTNMKGVAGSNFFKVPTMTAKERVATEMAKTASPYYDASQWEPTVEEAYAGTHHLLDGKYPVDTYGQTKQAAEYFGENWKAFTPRERREYCVKLASRMDELGIESTDKVNSYSGTEYSPFVDSMLTFRKTRTPEEMHPVLDTLMEKRAFVSPTIFAEALEDFDVETGLNWDWDAAVPDPWVSTFNEKLASDTFTFDANGVRTGEDELRDLALNGKELVEKQFGPTFMEGFAASPLDVFRSLPLPNKLVLARLASDRNLSVKE